MLCFCTVHNARALYDEFRNDTILDYTRKNISIEVAEQRALKHIKYIMTMNNVDYEQFDLPAILNEEPDPLSLYQVEDEMAFGQRCLNNIMPINMKYSTQ